MAEDDKTLFSSVVHIIEKFINNAGFWLWLAVFCATTYALDYFSEIRLNDLGADRRSLVVVLFGLSFCLLMNAINLHYYIWLILKRMADIIIALILFVVNSVVQPVRRRHEKQRNEEAQRRDEKNLKRGKEFFAQYMTVDCIERDWLVWFIFEWQPKDETFNIRRTGGTTDDSWTDRVAWFMWTHYILRQKYGGMWNDDSPSFDRGHYFLTEAFPLLDSLKDISASNHDIRSQIMEVRKEVSGLNPFQWNDWKKPRYSQYERKAEKDALIAARREFDLSTEKEKAINSAAAEAGVSPPAE
jgi:hypothetical protein